MRKFVLVPFVALALASFALTGCGNDEPVATEAVSVEESGATETGAETAATETAVTEAAATETTAAATETSADTNAAATETTPAATETTAAATETTATATDTTATATEAGCPVADGSAPQQRKFNAEPKMCIDLAKTYEAVMETNKGSMTFALDAVKAPRTTNSFVFLARYRYFEGIKFHRVVPDFVLQAGDPYSVDNSGPVGTGGPGYSFVDELPEPGTYKVGSLVMANSGPNTNGSQFFIVSGANGTSLPPQYAMFGQLTDGQATVDAIAALAVSDGPPSEDVIITKVTINEK
jgi:cyclophilin family peptidyl-prolyl cis-trans isomerase